MKIEENKMFVSYFYSRMLKKNNINRKNATDAFILKHFLPKLNICYGRIL